MGNKIANLDLLRSADSVDLRRLVEAYRMDSLATRAKHTDAEWHAQELSRGTADCVDEMIAANGKLAKQNDGVGGIFLERLVRGGINTVFRHEFEQRKFVNGGLIPIDMTISDGATSWDWQEIESVGEAALISDDASDVPMATITGESGVSPIHIYGIGYRYTRKEVRTAALQGRFSISQERAIAAREGHDSKMDSVLFEGDALAGTKGIINTPGILQYVSTVAGWATTATAAQVITEFGLMSAYQANISDGIEEANTCVMPIDIMARLRTLPVSTSGDAGFTVLAWLKANYPEITRWEQDSKMSLGDLPRTGPSVLLYRRDPSRIRAIMPMRMRPTTPEQRGLGWSTLFETSYGGLHVQRPKSVLNASGV